MFAKADVKIARALSQLTIPDILKVFGLNEAQPDAFYDDVTEYVNVLKNYPDMFAIGANAFHPYLVALVVSQLKTDTSFTVAQRQQMNQLEAQLVDSIKSKYENVGVYNTTKLTANSNEPLNLSGGFKTANKSSNSNDNHDNNAEVRNLSEGLRFGPPILNNITKFHEVPFKDVVRYKGSKPENLRNYIFRKITEIREVIETQMRLPKGRRQLKTKLNFLFEVDRKIETVLTRLEQVKSFSVAEVAEFKSDLAILDATLGELQNMDDQFSDILIAFYTVEERGENVEKETSQEIYAIGIQKLRNNMEEARLLIDKHISTLMLQFDLLNEPIIIRIDHIKHIFNEERHWWLIQLSGGLISEKIGFDNFDDLYIDPNGGKGLDKEMYYTNVNSKLLLWNSINSKEQVTADKADDYRKTMRAAIACTTALTIGTVMYYNDMFSSFGTAAATSIPMLTILAQQGLATGERVAGKFFDATARLPQGTQERLAGAVVDLVDGKATARSVVGAVVQTYAATLKQISDSLPSTVLRKVRLQIAGQKSIELIKYEQAVRTIRLDPSQYVRGRKEIATTIATLRSEIATLEVQMTAATSPEFRAAKGAEITAKSTYLLQISTAIPCESERLDPFWSITAWTSASTMSAAERARIEECIKQAIQRTALADFQTNLMTYAEVQSRLFDEADMLLKANARGLARLTENSEKRSPEQLKAHIRNIVKNSVRELEAGLGVWASSAAASPGVNNAATRAAAANEASRRAPADNAERGDASNAEAAAAIAAAKAAAAAANADVKAAEEAAKSAQHRANEAAAAARAYNGPRPGSSADPAEEHEARREVPLTAAQARAAARDAEAARGRAAAAALRAQAAEAHGKFARPTARGGSRKLRGRKLNATRKTGGAWTLTTGLTDTFMGALRGLAVLTKAGVEMNKERHAEAEMLAANAVVVGAEGRALMAARDREQKQYVADRNNVIGRVIGLGAATVGTIAAVAYSGGAAALAASSAATSSGASPAAAAVAGLAAGAAARTAALKTVATAADAAAMAGASGTVTNFIKAAANGAAQSKAANVLDAVKEFVEGGADIQGFVNVVREEGVFGSKLKTLVNAAPAVVNARQPRPVFKRRGLLNITFNTAPAPSVPAALREAPKPKPAVAPLRALPAASQPAAPKPTVAPAAARANVDPPLEKFDIDDPKTTIEMIIQQIKNLGLEITEEQLRFTRRKKDIIVLYKEALAKKEGSATANAVPKPANAAAPKPANALPKPANAAAPNPANAAPKPANAAPKPANAVPNGEFNVEKAGTGDLIKAIYALGEGNEEKQKALRAAISKCKAAKSCLKKIYIENKGGKSNNSAKLKEKAEEAKLLHQGDQDDEAKKEAAVAAGVAAGMTEDEAEDWLQEPPAGGKRKTRKLSIRRSNRTRRQ